MRTPAAVTHKRSGGEGFWGAPRHDSASSRVDQFKTLLFEGQAIDSIGSSIAVGDVLIAVSGLPVGGGVSEFERESHVGPCSNQRVHCARCVVRFHGCVRFKGDDCRRAGGKPFVTEKLLCRVQV